MADLVYNQAKFEDLLGRIDQNLKKLNEEKESYNQNFETVRKNWSGTEYEKAEPKLLEIGETIDKAIEDLTTQKRYLEGQNQDFASQDVGL